MHLNKHLNKHLNIYLDPWATLLVKQHPMRRREATPDAPPPNLLLLSLLHNHIVCLSVLQ